MFELVLAVLVVLVSSAICSGAEAALFSVSVVRARQLAETSGRGKAVLRIRENMKRPIATIVVLNNIANIVGSILVGAIAGEVLGDVYMGFFSAGLTFLVIIFAEIIPKTLGERHAQTIALWVAKPVLALAFVLTPVVWLLDKITAPITRGSSGPTTNESEIRLLAQIGRSEGVIEHTESELIERVFRLNDQTAKEIMTPRVAITHVRGDLTLEEATSVVLSSQHSRLVVTGDSVDQVTGVVLKHDILAAVVSRQGRSALVSELAQPIPKVDEDVPADTLMRQFLQSRRHLALVVGEFGGTAGVVTLEDVLETLTGEIVDETDRDVDLRRAAREARETQSE